MKASDPSSGAFRSDQKQRICVALLATLAPFLRTQNEVIDPLHPLAEYGIDATDLMTLEFAIEEQFGCKFPVSTFYDVETVADLAERIMAWLMEQGIQVTGRPGI